MYFGNMELGVYGLFVYNIKNDLCIFLIIVVNIFVIRYLIIELVNKKFFY